MSVEKTQKFWEAFYDFFPEVELPVTISESTINYYSAINKALPGELIDTYLTDQALFFADQEPDPLEEIEEFVPCFRLPQMDKYSAIVYWKAGLMKYEYILKTFDLKGKQLSKQIIASTSSDGQFIRHIVATINEDREIFLVGGDATVDGLYDASSSIELAFEIDEDGFIMQQLGES